MAAASGTDCRGAAGISGLVEGVGLGARRVDGWRDVAGGGGNVGYAEAQTLGKLVANGPQPTLMIIVAKVRFETF